jgi:hypothetical protein
MLPHERCSVAFESDSAMSPLSSLIGSLPIFKIPIFTAKSLHIEPPKKSTLLISFDNYAQRPNQSVELTATRSALTFHMTRTFSLRAPLALGGGSSLLSR